MVKKQKTDGLKNSQTENFDLRNRIKLVEIEKERLKKQIAEKKMKEKILTRQIINKQPKVSQFNRQQEKTLTHYETEKIEEIDKYNMYPIHPETDVLGDYVDRVIANSYQYYMNRPCPRCARILSNGGNSHQCGNFNHIVKDNYRINQIQNMKNSRINKI